MEIMVFISTTPDYPSWSNQMKFERCSRVIDWHNYIAELYKRDKVRQVWGSHQMLSRIKFTSSQGLLIAVYDVASLAEFDLLLIEDPLRDVSQYVTIPLEPLEDDRNADTNRFETVKSQLFNIRKSTFNKKGFIPRLVFSAFRSIFRKAPDYVGKYKTIIPKNPKTDIDKEVEPNGKLEILILGANPNEMITMWNDTRKFIHYEKVQWWHEYTNMMLNDGKISHVWGTHDFCHIESVEGVSAAAISVFTVDTYDEFDKVYKLDPIRDATMFWSIVLQPIKTQRKLDEQKLKLIRKRLDKK